MKSGDLAVLKSNKIEFEHMRRKCVGFHGTSKKSSLSILVRGFDLVLGDPKAWLGTGVYFYDNAPYSGSQFALCWARQGPNPAVEPAVVEADLDFKSLLDLNSATNEEQFWALHRLLRRFPDFAEVDEFFIAYYIGTHIAKEMGSDGVGWRFPLREPPERQIKEPKKQHGFAVKKLGAIGRVRAHTAKSARVPS